MDNKKLTLTIIAVAVAAIAGGGYFAHSTTVARQELINQQIEKFSKNLPSQFKFEKIGGEDGYLSSNGAYKLSFTHPVDSKYNGALLVNYSAEHGISSLLNGEVTFTGSTKIEGGIVSALKIKAKDNILSNISGTIDSNGSFSLTQSGTAIDLVVPLSGKDVGLKLKPFSGTINYNGDSGEINKTIKIPEIKGVGIVDTNWTVLFKNTEVKYTSNVNKLRLNKNNIKIGSLEIPTEKIKAEGVTINNSSEEKAKKPIVKFDSKISKLNTETHKDASFEFKSSLEGFDKNLFVVYQDLLPIYLSKKKVYDHKLFVKGMNAGLTFNIEKLSFNSNVEKVEVSGKYEISPTAQDKVFSLADQSKIVLSVNANPAFLHNVFGEPNDGSNADSNIAISVNYGERVLKINDVAVPEPSPTIIDLLVQLEEENGLSTPKPTEATAAVPAPVETTPEVKTEEVKVEEQK